MVRSAGRNRVLDLVFLVGVALKGLDGLLELLGGIVLLLTGPDRLAREVAAITAHELGEDPHDLVAGLLVHGVQRLDPHTTAVLAVYLLVHGVVKVGIVVALLLGSRRVYPWAIGALSLFLIYQVSQMILAPGVLVAVLTALDALIIVLTWREWREGRTLRSTARDTIAWVLRRPSGLSEK